MTFTYVGDLSTDLDKVRFYIGDSSTDSGVLPDASNFTDEELGGLITAEGNWQRAVAGACELLALRYKGYVDITVGPRRENLSQTAERFENQAKEYRKRYGGSTGSAGVRHPTPVDGYSNDISIDEV